jgi:uncharacterized alkaline shock family protein YloU
LNIFNKIIVVLILIFLIGISVVSMVNIFAGYFTWADVSTKILDPSTTVNKFVGFLALLAIFVISVFLLLIEFYRRRIKVANISSSREGNAMVTLETVSSQIRNEVVKVDGLKDIKVKIIPKTGGIIINMNAMLGESVDIPGKMQEIINVARGVVSEKLGIKVLKTNLTITGLAPGKEGKEESKIQTGEIEMEEEPRGGEEISEEKDNDK